MMYYLGQFLYELLTGGDPDSPFTFLRVFRYVTFRGAGAAVTALVLSLWLGPAAIRWLKRLKFGQDYQDRASQAGDLKARILDKSGTPTMGGILIVLVLDLSVLLWCRWNEMVVLALLAMIVLGGLGFYDDYVKVTQRHGGGVPSGFKLVVQGGLAAFVALYLWLAPPASEVALGTIHIPFRADPLPVFPGITLVGMIIAVLTIVGSSNAVNLTDGLDGLAVGCTLIVASVLLVFTYVTGHSRFAEYLRMPYVAGAEELAVFCAALIGACLGFLWFNCHPARVFMGDTGSLSLGGILGIIAVLIGHPLILLIAGGVFVAEAGSVILQTGWFKWTRHRTGQGRRLFRMAPIHHHFEKLGWYETQVVVRFYILCFLFAVLALTTLKLR